ncbi:insulinase family protein [Pseudomonadales bacterium]|jgi:Zn-dependent M16 (insulinase) family peptidase|nr:insulinase family protein [Pseudomonadales bacterium]
MNQVKSSLAGFARIRSHRIETLDVEVIEYEHRGTGAKHFHLASDHEERVFMVALRTAPEDSSGVAHILEHTALCGSARFPVRDPFFSMLRRSLNTFMNAFTASDYTAYPFASVNQKDFYNLLDVYLDAVFFARLDPLDFAQEGHRVEFSEADNSDSPLVYKGVVLNEMKGDMSSSRAVLWETLNQQLFPTVTYHHNSGGDPAEIPGLTYEAFKAFYEAHYHPSNAVFMTFGAIDVVELHEVLEDRALGHFEHSVDQIEVGLEHRLSAPVRHKASYAASAAGDEAPKSQLVMAWLLGESTDLAGLLQANLLSDALLDHSGSPLRRVLEAFPMAESVSPLTGLEESHREMSFLCGLEGVTGDAVQAFEAAVLKVIAEVAEHGIPIDQLKAVLHQIELSQREVGGDGMPYGLQLMFSCLSAAIHRGDPVELLDLDAAIETLRKDIEDPEFIKGLARSLLLENQHRVTVTLQPDVNLAQEKADAERARLQMTAQAMSDSERRYVMDQTAALALRQTEVEDLDLLPKVTLKDVPRDHIYPEPIVTGPVTAYAAGCNGIVYHQLIRELPELSEADWRLLPVLNQVAGELGFGGQDYVAAQNLQQSLTGGISAFASVRASLANVNQAGSFFVLSSRSLARNASKMMTLLNETSQGLRFDETARIAELVRQSNTRKQMGVVNQGHSLAMLAASAAFSKISALNHQLSGLGSLAFFKGLVAKIEEGDVASLAADLAGLYARFQQAPQSAMVIADEARVPELVNALLQRGSLTQSGPAQQLIHAEQTALETVYVTETEVNFCAAAYGCPSESSASVASVQVLAAVLRNQYLHAEIREKGGAYGGGASYDAANGLFRLYSYRDPELLKTFSVFDGALEAVRSMKWTSNLIEEAVLGLMSSQDAPGSPAGEARGDFYQQLQGRSHAHLRAHRAALFSVTPESVIDAAEQILSGSKSLAAITNSEGARALPDSFRATQL